MRGVLFENYLAVLVTLPTIVKKKKIPLILCKLYKPVCNASLNSSLSGFQNESIWWRSCEDFASVTIPKENYLFFTSVERRAKLGTESLVKQNLFLLESFFFFFLVHAIKCRFENTVWKGQTSFLQIVKLFHALKCPRGAEDPQSLRRYH